MTKKAPKRLNQIQLARVSIWIHKNLVVAHMTPARVTQSKIKFDLGIDVSLKTIRTLRKHLVSDVVFHHHRVVNGGAS